MDLALAIAEANPGRGGGPFGAVVADAGGGIVSLGWNDVIPGCDSTAHAEIVAIRRAQRAIGSHDLASAGPLTLYASCEPCIQCYGAIWWSGLRAVRAAATRAEAEALGFLEGPVTAELWAEALRVKGIDWQPGFGDLARAVALLRAYARDGPRY
ncbi:MAG: nucleoside deaminase [Planctomycetes bacterium]|nr:nucleoside deaminase [Planctomycetota bacterium]